MNIVELLKKGAANSLGFGMAVATVHLTVGVGLILALNTPPMTAFAAKSVPMEAGLALLVGLLFSPVLAAPRGEWIHPLLLAAVWLGLERWVAVDPTKLEMWVAPTCVATALFLAARAAFLRFPRAVVGVAVVLPSVLVFVPEVNYALGDYGPKPDPNRKPPPKGAPDVLFIVMDTTRAKSVSSIGGTRGQTPNFDALAKEGALYRNANSPATWSLPAHASLFTGHFPSSHEGHDETRFLDSRLPTLASTMASYGWQTLAFSANPYISDTFGLTRGFDYNDKAWKSGEGARQFSFVYRLADKLGFAAEDKGGSEVVKNIRNWMADRPADDPPAFVFVNFLEAHFPFQQLPEEFLRAYTDRPYSELADASQTAFGVQFGRQLTDEERERIGPMLLDMYEGGVKYTDHLVGQVIDEWRKRNRLDDTIVVILGDHGEMMGEHGAFGHVTSLYQPDLHVPYTIRYPKRIQPGTVVDEPVTTLTAAPTVLELLGLEPLAPMQAKSVLSDTLTPIFAERYEEKMLSSRFAPGTANGKGPLVWPRGRYRTCRDGKWKYTKYWVDGAFQEHLFDLEADPGELTDLRETQPDWFQATVDNCAAFEAAIGGVPALDAPVGTKAEKPELSKEECEQLVALGYMQGPCE
jgi:arylsulfatase A-like enzyme